MSYYAWCYSTEGHIIEVSLHKDFEIDIFQQDISDKVLDGDSVDHIDPKNNSLSIAFMETFGLESIRTFF